MTKNLKNKLNKIKLFKMESEIWNKYKIIKEIDNNSKIKTYLTRIEPIIKEISYKNKNEYIVIKEKIEGIKNKIKIYDIIEEGEKIYIVVDNNLEVISEIDKILLEDEIELKKEGVLKEQGNPVSKNEINELLEMEKSMCKIIYEKLEDNKIKKGKGTGFFCEIKDFPIKYALFTNNHILNENDIKIGKIINIEFLKESSYSKKKIEIDEKRKVYTNKELDYTCIELYKSDGFKDYFKIDPILFSNKNYIEGSDIFILQYPEGNELCFSYGKVLSLKDNDIIHSASTKEGSSGSPIIRRSDENYIIGLHYGGIRKKNIVHYSFNLATSFDSILNHITKPKEIIRQEEMNQKSLVLEKEDFSYDINNKKEIIEKKKMNQEKSNTAVRGNIFPDIMNISNVSNKDNEKFNNIIYYDPNINCLSNNYQDSDYFERATPGAFILCTNMDSFKLLRTEILIEIEKDKRISFNIITTGSQCDNVMQFLNEDPKFKSCIKKVCVYCMNIRNWAPLKSKYDLVYDVVTSIQEVKDFIQKFSSEEIKPYHLTKIITLDDYLEKYKERHFKISQFYGDLTPQTYQANIEKMKSLIEQEEEGKLYNKDKSKLLEGFLTFDLKEDSTNLDKLIIKEYTKYTFYGDLNKWLMNQNFNSFDVVAYFAARLMYSLNNYAKQEGKYYNLDETDIYRGIKISYSNILPYERAKGKIIVFPAFTSAFKEIKTAEIFSGRKNSQSLYKVKKKFSVILMIKNNLKKNWISNGIAIEDISQYKNEKEVLYQPFSFYYVRDVQIDLENYKADIYLETIGKKEILEEQIKIGKEIQYNENEKIMEVK